jgi:N-methylhydantoinase A
VLAALGLVVSPRRRDVQRSVFLTGDALTPDAVATHVSELGDQARAALGADDAELRAIYELRYRGQAFELAIPGDTEPAIDDLRTAFDAEHEDRYGYSDADTELELVTIRVTATEPGIDVPLAGADDTSADELERGRRTATLDGKEVEVEVIRGAPPPGTEVTGPAVVELAEATLLAPPGWAGEVDDTGSVRLTREG